MKNKMYRQNDKTDFNMVLLAVGFAMIVSGLVLAPVASAGNGGAFAPLVNNAWVLIGVGFIAVLIGGVLYALKMGKMAVPALLVGGILLAVGGGAAVIGWISPGPECVGIECPPDIQPPPGGYSASWSCNAPNDLDGAAHDAVTEFPDTPFIAADGGSPDLNKVIALDGTTLYADRQIKQSEHQVAVDDDLANTGAGYLATDTFNFDLLCFLTNPLPAVGGGLQEIPLWGRITLSRTTGTQTNGSYANVFYCDVTAGPYVGFGAIADSGSTTHTSDHTYKSYTDVRTCPGPAPLQGVWVPLGTSDGDTDGEWVSFWYVLDVGLSDYTAPPIGTCISALVEVGTDPTHSSYRGNIERWSHDICIDSRT
jgi:hypothetical protein